MDGRIDLSRRIVLGLAPQQCQLTLEPAVAPHGKIFVDDVQRPTIRLEIDDFLVVLKGRRPLARLPQSVGHPSEILCPLGGVVEQAFHFSTGIAIGGELPLQALQQRVA